MPVVSRVYRGQRRSGVRRGKGTGADPVSVLLLLQMCLAVIIGAFGYFIKITDTEKYMDLRSNYDLSFKSELRLDDIRDVIRSGNFFRDSEYDGEGMGGWNEYAPSVNTLNTQLPLPENASFAEVSISAPMIEPLSDYTVTSPFGYRYHPITGKLDFHTGVDLAAKAGTWVRSAYSGRVTAVGTTRIYGNYIIVEHGRGFSSFYGHLQGTSVRKGQIVDGGEKIGKVGSTGISTGPHLHFEIRVGGVFADPKWAFVTVNS